MRVIMRTNLADAEHACHAGGTIDLPDKKAQSLIDAGYAVLPPRETATRRSARKATVAAAETTALLGGNAYGGLFSGK